MAVAFVRQLGAESGVQLNPLVDASEIPVADNSDQVFGILMRSTRGRIDKPFKVDRSNVFKKLGHGEPIRISALNEAWVHVVEAVNGGGAYEAVIQRLVTNKSKISWIVIKKNINRLEFEVCDDLPSGAFLLAIKHKDCFNDGIKVQVSSDEKTERGELAKNDIVTLSLLDPVDDAVLFDVTASLRKSAIDDYGNSAFIEEVIRSRTDSVEVVVGGLDDDRYLDVSSDAYGYDLNGIPKKVVSATLNYFDEGGFAYTTADYMEARNKLQNTHYNYAYISSGGTRAPALFAQLALLAFDTNRQLRFDIPGDLSPEEAITFVEQLNMGASKTAHLMHAFWAPFTSDDPTGINGNSLIGLATLNIAYACFRNANTNAKGFAPKNYPIAGRMYAIERTGIRQFYSPTNQELNALAKAKINPCLYETYTGGGRYVFRDSLTCALVESSLKKLISVADMSTDIDDRVTRFGKDCLQLPMSVAIKRMRDFLRSLFEGAEASGWLVPSNEPEMGGAAFVFDVRPNEVRPYERMDISYKVRYDGTARQIFVTQTLSK